jgi:hypothetical protein
MLARRSNPATACPWRAGQGAVTTVKRCGSSPARTWLHESGIETGAPGRMRPRQDRSGSMLSKKSAARAVGRDSRFDVASGGLIGVFCLAHAGFGLDAHATN